MYTQRKFNSSAYKSVDNKSKIEAQKLFEKLGFTLKSDLNKEAYKAYDLLVEKNGKTYTVECEHRNNFHRIKNDFPTIHIPIRKQHCNFDYYIVWNSTYSELFAIRKSTVIKHLQQNIVELTCKDENGTYFEKFIDIPKEEALYLRYNNKIQDWI